VHQSTNTEGSQLTSERVKRRPYIAPIVTGLTLFCGVMKHGDAATDLVDQPLASNATYYSAAVSDPLLRVSLGEQQPVSQKDILVPLVSNKKVLGDIRVKIAMRPNQSNEIALVTLVNIIREYIDPALSAQLDKKSTSTTHITFRQLAQHGIELTFDSNNVELRVDFIARVRKPKRYGLATHATQEINDSQLLPNAKFSGALDYRVAKQWRKGLPNESNVELDGHLNVNGWVVQNQHSFADNRARKWLRGRTLITHDWPDNATRLSLGDLNYRQIGFMGFEPLSGISLSSNFALQPYELNYPISEQSFFLEQDAVVEVMVNGVPRDQRSLTAGAHNIYDLPLIDGVNEIELRITDIFGRQQLMRLLATQDQRLLAPGKEEYSVTLGVPRLTSQSGLEYAHQSRKFSAFYRNGLTDDFTLGNWLQLGRNVLTTGVTGVRKSVYGVFSGEIAVSRDSQLPRSYASAVRVGYRFRSQRFTVDAQWNWQHREFANLSQAKSDNNIHHQARISLTLPRFDQWTTNLTATHGRRWQGESIFSKQLNVTRQLGQDWHFSVNMAHYNSHAEQESFAGIQLYWSPGDSRHRASIRYISDDDQRISDYRYRRDGELGFNMQAGIRESDISQQQDAAINYLSAHLDTRLAVEHSKAASGQSSITKRASLGSSVAFADGQWATSRPLQGQPFAILSAKPSISDAHIGVVRGAAMKPVAFLDRPSDTSVLPNLSPYYVNNVYLDLSLAPAELQVQQENFKLKPAYHSATVISVGTAGRAYVTAKLIGSAGLPLGYKVVNVTTVNGTEHATTFTDAFGFVVIEGLQSGKYRISVPGQPILTKLVTIPDKQHGKVELGTLRMSQEDG
jgi:outer membrane usher protein